MDDGLLAELVGSPGNAAAMVAVSGGEEGGLAEVAGELVGGEVIVGAIRDVLVGLVGNVVSHREGAAEDLEGVEAEAIRLVLHGKAGDAEALGLLIEASKRRHRILGEALVEGAGLLDVLQGHNAEVRVIALGHLVNGPFDPLAHVCVLSVATD